MRRTTISPVSASFAFAHEQTFEPAHARELTLEIPALPGVVALFGHDASAQPYLTRAADLRRRVRRLVDPPPTLDTGGQPMLSKRLNLRDRIARIAWTVTGSEFESLLTLYHATSALFGADEARRRLKLRTPFFLRLTMEHAHPRVYATNRLGRRHLETTYGPFASRTAAERFGDAALDLFHLRRCHEDLAVHPEHPGCVYGEMKKCMAPCNTTCTAAEYAAEATAVRGFFDTHGDSLLSVIAHDRERASEAMDFEQAAALHRQYEKVKAAAALAPELVRPLTRLRAVVIQHATRATADEPEADLGEHPEQAAVFLLERGCLTGPRLLSTLGVRAVREQTAVGSSLFAQPLMLRAVPLPGDAVGPAAAASSAAESPEQRAAAVLAELAPPASASPDPTVFSDHLALLRRWYYRPEKQRAGEIFFPSGDGSWPIRRILNGAARAALGDPRTMQETDREGARSAKTRLLHAGREGVKREVPVPGPVAMSAEETVGFRSRRRREQRP